MVHSDYDERHANDDDPNLGAKVIIVGLICAFGLWGLAGFVIASLF